MRKGIGNEFNKLFDTLNATTFGKSQKNVAIEFSAYQLFKTFKG